MWNVWYLLIGLTWMAVTILVAGWFIDVSKLRVKDKTVKTEREGIARALIKGALWIVGITWVLAAVLYFFFPESTGR